MKFVRLAESWLRLEGTSSRLEMTEILAELLGDLEVEETAEAVYLSLGRLGPKYDTVEFQLAEKMMMRAVAEVLEWDLVEVKRRYKELGDLGDVMVQVVSRQNSVNSRSTKNPNTGIQENYPTVNQVYDRLLEIAKEAGNGSQERKVAKMVALLRSVDSLSGKYIVRVVLGKLRLGFSEMTVLDGISWMICGDKSLHGVLEDAYNVRADVGALVDEIKGGMVESKRTGQESLVMEIQKMLQGISVVWGTPVVPALCQRLETFNEVVEKMGEVACEPKYDGARLQIHFRRIQKSEYRSQNEGRGDLQRIAASSDSRNPGNDGKDSVEVRSFTRSLDENTQMFPELQLIKHQIEADELVLDAEAMGYDPESGSWLPFQQIMTRKRKHGVGDQAEKVPLRFMVFDVLYVRSQNSEVRSLNGDVHDLPLSQRRVILEKVIGKGDYLEVVPLEVTTDPDLLRKMHFDYLGDGLEGVIVKKWDAPYTPGRKGRAWVKMKEVETAEAMLADTLDCVVMGYYGGRGKRAGFGLGAFLVGVLKNESIVTVSKVGTGLTDDQFRDMYKKLGKLEVKERPSEYAVDKNLEPDVWVNPELVVEIAADNLTESKIHTSGMGLRFPRLVRFRDDKDWEQATTLQEVDRLFEMQFK